MSETREANARTPNPSPREPEDLGPVRPETPLHDVLKAVAKRVAERLRAADDKSAAGEPGSSVQKGHDAAPNARGRSQDVT